MHKPFHQLLTALAAQTGLAAPDASGDDCLTVFFDGLPLTLEYLPENDSVLFFSALGRLPRDNREDFCLKLLEANHFFSGTGGATLSAHRSSGVVGLHMVVSMRLLDEAQFMQYLETYMYTAEQWAKACAQADEAPPAQDRENPPDSGWVPI